LWNANYFNIAERFFFRFFMSQSYKLALVARYEEVTQEEFRTSNYSHKALYEASLFVFYFAYVLKLPNGLDVHAIRDLNSMRHSLNILIYFLPAFSFAANMHLRKSFHTKT
jgi:hypothetical protein